MGACSTTRGVFGLGADTSVDPINVINYLTIATTGNALDFGDLTVFAHRYHSACSSSTRIIWGGGGAGGAGGQSNVVEYATIATTGNTTDFGDLTAARQEGPAALSSKTRGVFCGGTTTSSITNIIDYVTIASVGNATDFGDLINASAGGQKCTALSNCHGGL